MAIILQFYHHGNNSTVFITMVPILQCYHGNVLILIPGVWLSAFNSVANPFVYALLMPTYRKCVINTFCACLKSKTEKALSDSIRTLNSVDA